jgi:murein DD-endopeptidase MepM/ murein hydrolase activator NlpD
VWLRRSLVPAVAIASVAVWGVGDALHVLGGERAGSTVQKAAASVPVDLSALATQPSASSQAALLALGAERVSRSSRTSGEQGLSASTAAALRVPLPARTSLPKVQDGQSVPGTWIRPSAGGESSCFCMRWGVMHEGIDLAGPLGSPIVAVGDGVVVEAGPSEGFGHWIVIQHSNGDLSIYGHMYTVLVSVGEHVTAGEHIADIGSDGQSTGPHLHFGVKRGGMSGPYIDPVPWLKARGIDVGPYNPNA